MRRFLTRVRAPTHARQHRNIARWTDLIIQVEQLVLTEKQSTKKETRGKKGGEKAYLPVLYKRVSSSHSRLPSPTQVRSNNHRQDSISQHKHLHEKNDCRRVLFHNLPFLYAHVCGGEIETGGGGEGKKKRGGEVRGWGRGRRRVLTRERRQLL